MNQKGSATVIFLIAIIIILAGIGGYYFLKKPGEATINPTPTPTKITRTATPTLTAEIANWLPFKSSFFTLSFKIPSSFEVKEGQNYILVAKSPYYTREIGDDNAFFRLTRYNSNHTRESQLVSYRKLLKNIQESTVAVDNSSFLTLRGDDWGRFEGDSAGKVVVVFFDASWLEIMERPASSNQSFNPITIGNQILSTFKFTK